MLINRLRKKPGIAVVTPESTEDLWVLRRILKNGDIITSQTKRVIKNQKEFTRPDKGERINVKLSIELENISIDQVLERIRVSGKITETTDDSISKGSYHSLNITLGNSIAISKKELEDFQIGLLKKRGKKSDRYIIITIDRRQAGLGLVTGTHLRVFPDILSGLAGKMYKTKATLDIFFEELIKSIANIDGDNTNIVVTGPTEVKRSFTNYVGEKKQKIHKKITIIDGIDLAGQEGVYMALKHPSIKEFMKNSELSSASLAIEDAINRISKNDNKVSYSFKDVKKVANMGAIEKVMISSKIFELIEEEEIIILLDEVEKYDGQIYLLDSSTEVGKQIDSVGGIISLLRYPVYDVD
ncbi:MAG: mRNA surveillance protein pelota [Thaumarchaeota archaeon]|nr:mRNA surveillance protein pelota [Nitrososphaerota archaeon]|tara:strand:- start:10355 stop:11422 length:1068 start_codon:yes stop_codon:yes gene_type:complete